MQSSASTADLANRWLDRRLAVALDAAHRRTRGRTTALAIAIALSLGAGTVSLSLAMGGELPAGSLNEAALVMIVSLATAAALHPVLRLRDQRLLQAASTISHDNLDFLLLLGKLTELRSGETAGHNLRVTVHTLLFAEAVGLAPGEIVRAVKGALLHDIGKLAVPDRILNKPGPLTPEERADMEMHVAYGLDIVAQSRFLREAALVVGGHHEKFDGSGYPSGLKGASIPREARLFALVDVFDALTSPRVYKPGYGIDASLAMMEAGRGSHFDPALFDRFKVMAPDLVRRLPGSEAELTAMLMDRLLPYVDRLVGQEPALHADV
jgi:putative nucleotidyltransferase with HDIG domain